MDKIRSGVSIVDTFQAIEEDRNNLYELFQELGKQFEEISNTVKEISWIFYNEDKPDEDDSNETD